MDQLVIETIIEKVEAAETRLNIQGKELFEITKKVSTVMDQADTIKTIANLMKKLQDNMYTITWPVREMAELSNQLARNNELLANPKKSKQVVFHTAGKLIWVISGLSIVIILLIIGLINSEGSLDQYRMNDMIWRYIKLSNGSQNLKYLQSVEGLYLTNPEKMKSLVENEELKLKQIAESEINNPVHNASDATSSLNKKKKIKLKNSN
jgi:hypothetical protein